MQAPFDITTINNAINLKEERTQLEQLIVSALQKEYPPNEMIFRAFSFGPALQALYKSINNLQAIIISDHREVIEHINEIVKIQKQLTPALTEMYQPLIEKIEQNEFNLLQQLIAHLAKIKDPTSDIMDDCQLIGNVIYALLPIDNSDDSAALSILSSLTDLWKKLNKRTLQNKIRIIEIQLYDNTQLCTKDHQQFEIVIQPLKENLEQLIQATKKISLDSLTIHIEELLAKIDTLFRAGIKQDLNKTIETLVNNPWIKVANKKISYNEVLSKINELLELNPSESLTDDEKTSYSKQLFAGFELTNNECFLNIIECFSKIYYTNQPDITQKISDYISSYQDSVVVTKTKKRVRFSDEAEQISVEKQKKPRIISPLSFDKNCSPLVEKFINILDPVTTQNADLSKRFSAAILDFLATSVYAIKNIRHDARVLMKHNILTLAAKICPKDKDASKLLAEIEHKIEDLHKQYGRLINDNHKFSRLDTNSDIIFSRENHQTVACYFKKILSGVLDEVEVSIPDTVSFEQTIEQITNNFFSAIKTDKSQRIKLEILEKIQTQFLTYKPVDTQQLIQEESSTIPIVDYIHKEIKTNSKYGYEDLVKTLKRSDSSGFSDYINQLKTSNTAEKFLQILLERNKAGYTALHSALDFKCFTNFVAYIYEVKAVMFELKIDSFSDFLTSQTNNGLTFLHLIAKSGNLALLIETIEIFKTELTFPQYKIALALKTNYGFTPSCPTRYFNASQINDYLDKEWSHCQQQQRSNMRHSSPDRFFHHQEEECSSFEEQENACASNKNNNYSR